MHKSKILVVDDEASYTRMLRLSLEDTGHYEVRVENKGTQAVAVAEEYKPDIILMDLVMPDAEGQDIVSEMRTRPLLKKVPVIFLSGLVEPSNEGTRFTEAGNYTLASKPVRFAELVALINQKLGQNAV